MDYETLSETEWDQVQRVWDLMDEGRLDTARIHLGAMLSLRPGHPDLRIVDAALALEEGNPRHALDALVGAERSADPAVFFHLRGLAHHDVLEFESAQGDAERALAVRPDMPDAHDLLSRTLEYLGEWKEAEGHAVEAHGLDPEHYPLPLEIGDDEFDQIVQSSLRELPEPVRERLDEIPILVEALPPRSVLAAENPPLTPDLLGLFIGRHLLERAHDDLPGAPGAIFLFRRNLLRMCHSKEELAREIRITVQHEVGHLLGLDEEDLERWGLA